MSIRLRKRLLDAFFASPRRASGRLANAYSSQSEVLVGLPRRLTV